MAYIALAVIVIVVFLLVRMATHGMRPQPDDLTTPRPDDWT